MPRVQTKRTLLQVGSLFAGLGGFCLAFAKEGFEIAWANERDSFAVQTYRHNFPGTPLFHKPIEDLSVIADDLKAVDVVTAGFPCQPFSVAGAKLGFDDDRGREGRGLERHRSQVRLHRADYIQENTESELALAADGVSQVEAIYITEAD